jgi:hypothetical protein
VEIRALKPRYRGSLVCGAKEPGELLLSNDASLTTDHEFFEAFSTKGGNALSWFPFGILLLNSF